METTVKELPDSRVRVDVDVDPQDVEGSISRTAQQLGKDMKMPGFRKGKVPPEMVVQRLGRETVLTQALESSLGDWYERAMLESGVNPVGDPKLDLSDLPEEGKPLTLLDRGRRAAGRRARRVQGPRGRPRASRRSRRRPSRPSSTGCARASRGSSRSSGRRSRATCVLIDYEGKIDGEPFEGGKAKDYLLELGEGRVLPELRGGARRRRGRRRAPGRRCPSPTTIRPRRSPARPPSSTSRSRRSARRSCPSSTTTSPPRPPSSTPSTSCASTSPSRSGEILDRPDRRALPRGRPRRRRRRRPRSRCPDPVVEARAAEMWRRVERSAAAAGDGSRELPADAGQDARGDDRGGPAGRRAGAEAGGGAGGGRRGRGDRDHRGGRCSRRSRSRRARGPRASRACRRAQGDPRVRAATSCSTRTCGCGARSS